MTKSVSTSAPQLIVCMGVSGTGKSTLALQLSQHLGWKFIEGDDFHSLENRQQMENGIPLTDLMRKPWMTAITARLNWHFQNHEHCVLAFSGLRAEHRNMVRAIGFQCCFLNISVSAKVLTDRLAKRRDHFMPVSLLNSQIQTMQSTDQEKDVCLLNGQRSKTSVLEQALLTLSRVLQTAPTI